MKAIFAYIARDSVAAVVDAVRSLRLRDVSVVEIRAALWPVVGDERYGSARRFAGGIALHARILELNHPTSGKRLSFVSPLPVQWAALGVREPMPDGTEDKREEGLPSDATG